MTTWAGFSVGDRFESAGLTVTETHLVMWSSLTGDWNPLHTDAVRASSNGFGERIAHGPLTLSLAIGLVTRLNLFESVIAWLGLDNVRAQAPVMIGDTISVIAEITVLRPTRKPGRDMFTLTYTVRNQRDEQVMTFDASFLVRSGQPQAALA